MEEKKEIRILLIDINEFDYLLIKELLTGIKNQKYTINWIPAYDKALSERYSKGSSFTHLKDHTLHILSRGKPSKEGVRYGMEGGKYEDTETKVYPVV